MAVETPVTLAKGIARSAEGALAPASALETFGLVVGTLGATAVGFGVVLFALDPNILPVALLNSLAGLVGLAVYLVTHRKRLARRLVQRSTPFAFLEASTWVGAVLAFFAINWFFAQDPIEWDLTRDGLYTLQPQSAEVADALDEPLTVYAILRPGAPLRPVVKQLVELYQQRTDRLRLEFINPDQPPAGLLDRLGIEGSGPRLVVASADDRVALVKSPTEEALTNGLIHVSQTQPPVIAFIEGHGEPSPGDQGGEDALFQARTALEDEGYSTRPLSLFDTPDVPADVSVVVLASGRRSWLKPERDALERWLERGGRVIALLEAGEPTGLEDVWRSFGIGVADDLVIDQDPAAQSFGFGPDAMAVRTLEPHPITRPFKKVALIFYRARSLRPLVERPPEVETVTLVRTSPESWAEPPPFDTAPSLDEDDTPGPFALAIAASRRIRKAPERVNDEARVVVVGDRHFAGNRFLPLGSHRDLWTNMVGWLVGEKGRISLRPNRASADRLALNQSELYGIMFFSVNLLPLTILGFGFSVWAVRRRR